MLKIKHQSLAVRDLDVSAAFYTRHFGYEVIKRQSRPDLARAVLQRPDHTLQLMSGTDVPTYDWRSHLAFITDQFDQLATQLPLLREPYRLHADGPRILFAHDPDGYPIELVERTLS